MQDLQQANLLELENVRQEGETRRAELSIQKQAPQLFEAYFQAISTIRNEFENAEWAEDMIRRLASSLDASLPYPGDVNYNSRMQQLNSLTAEDLEAMIREDVEGLDLGTPATDEQISEAVRQVRQGL